MYYHKILQNKFAIQAHEISFQTSWKQDSYPVTPILKAACFVIHKQSPPPPSYVPKIMKPQRSVNGSLPFLFCSSLSDHAGVFLISNCSRGESILKWHL